MEKMFNKNIDIGFQNAVFHLCQQALRPGNGLYLGLGKTNKAFLVTSVFSNITFNFEFYSMLGVKIIKVLSFSH